MSQLDDEVLFVTDRHFWRRSMGSEQRIASLVRFFCRRGLRVAVAHVGRIDRRESHRLESFVAECPGLTVVTRPDALRNPIAFIGERSVGTWKRIRERLPSRRPRSSAAALPEPIAGRTPSPARRAFVERVIDSRSPRVVVIEFLRLTGLIMPRPHLGLSGHDVRERRQPVYVVDTIDLLHERAESFHAQGLSLDHGIDAEEEARALATFDAAIAIQARDAGTLRRLVPSIPVLEVPHGLSMPKTPYASNTATAESPLRLGFLGGRDASNIQALDWLVDRVWPQLSEALGRSVELHVAGQICSVWKAPHSERIRIWGPIDSIERFWPVIDVALNPTRSGSGLKIKSVEALAYGRPLLTTSIGAQGLEDASPGALRIDDTPEGWIDALLAWAADADLRARMAEQGRTYAYTHFSEEKAFGPLLQYLEEVMR